MRTPPISSSDRALIAAAVADAEANTAGEIVTIIADHSDRYLDVALWWAIGVAALALAVVAAVPPIQFMLLDVLSGGWAGDVPPAALFELALAIFVLKFAAVRLILQYWPLRIWMTPGVVKRIRVRRRALRYFKVGAEKRTAQRTGILIYLSMAERRAEIVTDDAVHAQVADDRWGEAMADLIADVRRGRVADGMAAAVGDIGAILAECLPRAADDRNELPDRVIEL